MKKFALAIVVLLVSGFIITSFVIGGIIYIRKTRMPDSVPVVDLRSPPADVSFQTGEPIMVQAIARDPDGVVRIEFWLDQNLVHFEDSPWKEGITPLPFAYSFFLNNSGSHEIIVRAFDVNGMQGQISTIIDATQGTDPTSPKSYEISEGDTLASIADDHALTEEDVAASLPEGSDDLPPAGTVILLPPPAPETEGDPDLPDEVVPLPDDYRPSYLPQPFQVMPYWLHTLDTFFVPPTGPVGLMDLTSLEVDRPYDGVYCYISAGDSPVIRAPSSASFVPLEANFWDIAEWFSGERALSFINSTGDLRLRMNCMGYTIGTAGGVAYNLGTLDITRPPAEYATGWLDERAAGPDGWFRVRFRAGSPPDEARGGGGFGDSYLSLVWTRYGVNENVLNPNPHVILDFGFYEFGTCGPGCEGPLVPPPVMDGFQVYRNNVLWETIPDPRTSRYILWDNFWEAGGCFENPEFYIKGYLGDPASPTRTVDSNVVMIPGYCPEVYKFVTVRFSSIYFDCINVDLRTMGGLIVSGACAGLPQDYGPGVYGGINVNGSRTFDIWYPVYSRMYVEFPIWSSTIIPTEEVLLSPGESLTISSTMWDYDVWSDSDPFCYDSVTYSPSDLDGMVGHTTHFDETFSNINWFNDDLPLDTLGGSCVVSYDIIVEEVSGPPPPSIVTIP